MRGVFVMEGNSHFEIDMEDAAKRLIESNSGPMHFSRRYFFGLEG